MKKVKLRKLIPIIVPFVAGLISILVSIGNGYTPGSNVLFGILLLVLCGALYFVNHKIFKITTGIVLLLGTIDLILFSNHNYVFYFFGIPFSLIAGIPFILHLFFNWSSLKNRLLPEPKPVGYKKTMDEGKISYFKQKFSQLDLAEINRRLGGDLVAEARLALEDIKKKKTSHNNG